MSGDFDGITPGGGSILIGEKLSQKTKALYENLKNYNRKPERLDGWF